MLEIPARDRIIVALDCPGDEALHLAANLEGHAKWLKVGMTLYYAQGPLIVHALKQRGFKVFLDLKFHDIPHQVAGAAKSAVEAGADMLTMHAVGGAAMMEAAQHSVEDTAAALGVTTPITLAITVLTSMDARALAQTGVVCDTVADQVKRLATSAKEAGLSGVVCSPKEAADMRALLGPEAAIVTPGVRPAGADLGDQSRVATPAAALEAGASHLVIGRPITQAADPVSAFETIVSEL